MGSLAWWVGLCAVASSATACGGNEFSTDGETGGADAGSDATVGGSGGGGGSGGSGASGGAGDASSDGPVNKCTSELFNKTCQDPEVTTGDNACDTCGRANCCNQTNACLANATCAQELKCYLESCLNQSALNCVPSACPACLGSSLIFVSMSSCLQNSCKADCPMLIQ
ncbi:MAG: hypothetical protein HYZ29_27690 [Myxococcales bacterium]|nr:hypothetical protein [Myxococcales bacterium]